MFNLHITKQINEKIKYHLFQHLLYFNIIVKLTRWKTLDKKQKTQYNPLPLPKPWIFTCADLGFLFFFCVFPRLKNLIPVISSESNSLEWA